MFLMSLLCIAWKKQSNLSQLSTLPWAACGEIYRKLFATFKISRYIPNSKKVALPIGHWQMGIGYLGTRNTMQCFA